MYIYPDRDLRISDRREKHDTDDFDINGVDGDWGA